ncbi:Cystathionine gamma-synthase [Penicillium taxi]|uniref:Cystathionine gamma-synthase n=1 Tax=Penicillium taxi TaxID=168475 RepID=UPI00254549B5|nr:Cystathionine gamma-synthase [Penicillium taxi]KAJ5887908.1 Cystathionine gamma-synthase [Penicillium taxi]
MVSLPQPPALGQPVPSSHHAVSVQLPTWDDIKEIFTGAKRMQDVQMAGYPRSFIHEDVKKLHQVCIDEFANDSAACFLFPSIDYANGCVQFATSSAIHQEDAIADHLLSIRSLKIELEASGKDQPDLMMLHAVFCPADITKPVKEFWRLVGAGISSRLAQHCMDYMRSISDVTGKPDTLHPLIQRRMSGFPHRKLCQRIATLLERAPACARQRELVSPNDVYLYPTGMTAIYQAQQLLSKWRDTQSVVFGVPYDLTLKLIETYSRSVCFLPFGKESDLDQLEEHLVEQARVGSPVQAIWCECPSNPLLRTPNLRHIRKLADQYGAAVVVDDTVGGFANVDLLGVADILVTSLTKSFSGKADVMAGSLVLNPASPFYSDLKRIIEKSYQNHLFSADAIKLEMNSRDFLDRTARINDTASYIMRSLKPLVNDSTCVLTKLYHPELDPRPENYRAQMRKETKYFKPGYGGLFTMQFEDVELAKVFFNCLNVHKGPSLGAPVTLAQPYVQTVFHNQIEWAGNCGLHESIVRVSVGMEDKYALLVAFHLALAEADRVMAARSNPSPVKTKSGATLTLEGKRLLVGGF